MEESLAEYVRVEKLEGDDRFRCDTCAEKRDATRQISLLALPPVLCLQLIRFVYDVNSNSKKKVRGCYPVTRVLAHTCECTTSKTRGANSQMRVRAYVCVCVCLAIPQPRMCVQHYRFAP